MNLRFKIRIIVILIVAVSLIIFLFWRFSKNKNNVSYNFPDSTYHIYDSIEIAVPIKQKKGDKYDNTDKIEKNTSFNVEEKKTIPEKKTEIEKEHFKKQEITYNSIPMDSVLSMVFVEGGKIKKPINARMIGVIADTLILKESSFFIGKYEVTNELYYKFIKKQDNKVIKPELPVNYITMPKVIEFCNAVNKAANLPPSYDNKGNLLDINGHITKDVWKVKGYRLPTAKEWEFAARGGVQTNYYLYSGSNNPNEIGWWRKACGDIYNYKLHPVGLKKPNELGIYDMTGNASELCNDICPKSIGHNRDKRYEITWKLRIRCGDPFYSNMNFENVDCNYEMSASNSNNQVFTNSGDGFRITRTEYK